MVEVILNIFIHTHIGHSLAAALIFVTIIWLIAWRLNRYDLVDVAWPGIFIIIALLTFLLRTPPGAMDTPQPYFGWTPRVVVTTLVLIWALRLGFHLYKRWRSSSEEDYRYNELRKKWKKHPALHAYFEIYLTQGILAWVVSMPVMIINFIDGPADTWLIIGLVVWFVGLLFEAVSDHQLAKFKQNAANKGRLLTTGLWRFTRHPNYFGEVVVWWGIFLIGAAYYFGSGITFAMAILGPLMITYLILFVSGVPMTEEHFEGRHGWSEYKRTRLYTLQTQTFQREIM